MDAFINMLERYGTMSFEEVAEPAIRYAEDGIPHYEYMLERLRSRTGQEQFDNFPPGGWEVFYEDREVPAPGAMMRQPGLANTLKAMRDASANASGSRVESLKAARAAFYEGPVAELIVEESRKVGGILSMDDLAGYRSQFGQPVTTSFGGYDRFGVRTPGPRGPC